MTRLLDEALRRLDALPADRQDEAARLILDRFPADADDDAQDGDPTLIDYDPQDPRLKETPEERRARFDRLIDEGRRSPAVPLEPGHFARRADTMRDRLAAAAAAGRRARGEHAGSTS